MVDAGSSFHITRLPGVEVPTGPAGMAEVSRAWPLTRLPGLRAADAEGGPLCAGRSGKR